MFIRDLIRLRRIGRGTGVIKVKRSFITSWWKCKKRAHGLHRLTQIKGFFLFIFNREDIYNAVISAKGREEKMDIDLTVGV